MFEGVGNKKSEIYFPEDSIPILINKKSPSLNLIQHLRDEAHRFAISFHRQQRSKNSTTSQLDSINGIGPKTKEKLLKTFKSYKRIENVTTPHDSQLRHQPRRSHARRHRAIRAEYNHHRSTARHPLSTLQYNTINTTSNTRTYISVFFFS